MRAESKPIPYLDRQTAITAELQRLARERTKRITYGEFGRLVGIPSRGPWKAILDHVCETERAEGRPDITILIVKARTRLPGQIAGESTDIRSAEHRDRYNRTLAQVLEFYSPRPPS
jgi:hypothetical protein